MMKFTIGLLAVLLSFNVLAADQANVLERSTDILFNSAKNTAITKVNRELYDVHPQAAGIARTVFDDVTQGSSNLETSPNLVDLIYTTIYGVFD